MNWETVIGLEVHSHLATQTKIFCGCNAEFGGDPNTHGCPVCLGLPGALPVLNAGVVDLAMRMALAVGCTIQPRSRFLRKNYFYPDLPKGYQVSQFQSNLEMPLATGGGVQIPGDDGPRFIHLTRIHMEEDAGKSIHEETFVPAGESMVDVNRCGVPLIEIVSEPDIESPEEAVAFLTRLHRLLVYTGASEGDMEKGHLRIDANVSIRPKGQKELGVKTELKNINSFRYCQRGLEAAIRRQVDILESGGEIIQETLLYDPARDEVRPMRTKEYSDDYRYFPEPDLVPIVVDEGWIERIRGQLPELPEARAARFVDDYGLSSDLIEVLTASREIADYFEATVTAGAPALEAANWVQGTLLRVLNERKESIDAIPVRPEGLADLIALIQDDTISRTIAREVFDEMISSGKAAAEIVEVRGLRQISDTGELEGTVAGIIADHPDEAGRYRDGDKKLMGFFMGNVMKATQGKANPKLATDLLRRMLDS